jgi:hypothetical protein
MASALSREAITKRGGAAEDAWLISVVLLFREFIDDSRCILPRPRTRVRKMNVANLVSAAAARRVLLSGWFDSGSAMILETPVDRLP